MAMMAASSIATSTTRSEAPPATTLLPHAAELPRSTVSSGTSTPTASTSKPACSTCPTHLLKTLKRDGYVHIPALLDPSQLSTLRSASAHITTLARSGQWPHIRAVPKLIPPWPTTPPPDSEGGIWGVQHLLHPQMPSRKEFAKVYFGNRVIAVVKELLGLNLYDPRSEEKIVMEMFDLLVSPSGNKDFEPRWHREGISWDVNTDEERKQLDEKSPCGKQAHAQYNIALSDDDDSLVVIPGSHRRVRTDLERDALPHELELPDQVVVRMKAGDAVFYDDNILHRGVYNGIDLEKDHLGRMTLHGSVGLYGHNEERAKNVLQQGVGDWADAKDAPFTELQGKCRDRAEGMRLRLVEMGAGDDGGSALDD